MHEIARWERRNLTRISYSESVREDDRVTGVRLSGIVQSECTPASAWVYDEYSGGVYPGTNPSTADMTRFDALASHSMYTLGVVSDSSNTPLG